ncbi:MAG: VOC family protein [Pseudorhodobacter sp.]|nr:VOC family protein [Rhizobacter sp.]
MNQAASSVLTITRTFDAPLTRVFDAWTNPDSITGWWGPKDFTLLFDEKNLEPGGPWRMGMTRRGEKVVSAGVYAVPQKPPKTMLAKNTICVWFDKDAQAAAHFYAATFPGSAVSAVHLAPSDFPGGKKGDVLTVDFSVAGVACLGLNGGPMFKHSEAFSFQIATDDQEETDRYWDAIVGNGGQESECGWCKDGWGLSWQITPRELTEALAAGGDDARRAFDAMMTMKKIDVAAMKAAQSGVSGAAGRAGNS